MLSAFAGYLGRSEYIAVAISNTFYCILFFAHSYPHNKFYLNWMKHTEIPIFEIWSEKTFTIYGDNVNISLISTLTPKWHNLAKLPQAKMGNLVSPAWVKNQGFSSILSRLTLAANMVLGWNVDKSGVEFKSHSGCGKSQEDRGGKGRQTTTTKKKFRFHFM